MSKETIAALRKMNTRSLEVQLANQCAPLITGLKAANLLVTRKNNISSIRRLLRFSDLDYYILYTGKSEITLLLYRNNRLHEFLQDDKIQNLLRGYGYRQNALAEQLFLLQKRYTSYRLGKAEFPHEMGVFLEYPIEDVVGFIENNGKNSLYCGYWKVYKNKAEKLCLFQRFENARECLIMHLANGRRMEEVIAGGNFQ